MLLDKKVIYEELKGNLRSVLDILRKDAVSNCLRISVSDVFVIVKHRSNIARLCNGTENKIYIFGRPGGKKKGES